MALIPATANKESAGIVDIVSETASYAIVVYGGTIHNGAAETVEVGIRSGDGGTDWWHAVLGPNGSGSLTELMSSAGDGVELAVNTPLVMNLSGATNYNVDANVVYKLRLIG